MAGNRRSRRRPGDILAISLSDGSFGFGRVMREPLIAFFDLNRQTLLEADEVAKAEIAFILLVMNSALGRPNWRVIGHIDSNGDQEEEPVFFKKDSISKKLTIYTPRTGTEVPATRDQCEGLECAAVWSAEHVEDRLLDHFKGRANQWVEIMRP